MSFSFDFALDDEADAGVVQPEQHAAAAPAAAAAATSAAGRGRSWTLAELIETLPERISYSTLHVPLDGLSPSGEARSVPVFRRDLFDARFQVLTRATEEAEEDEAADEGAGPREKAEAEAHQEVGAASDLLPGVYEGGLKTWECSLDLIAALDTLDRQRTAQAEGEKSEAWGWLRGKKILELGCGTAIPSAFLLQRLFSLASESAADGDGAGSAKLKEAQAQDQAASQTAVHLCDFNAQVLQLVTLPNLLLAWYFSPSSASYRATQGVDFLNDLVPSTGDLSLTPDLLIAFETSLATQHIELRFSSGDWSALRPAPQDVVLSSETIYAPASLGSLLETLRQACRATPSGTDGLCARIQSTSLSSSAQAQHSTAQEGRREGTTCLIAAKILYFGVGGGVRSFEAALQARGGWSESVRETKSGVGRVVLSVGWAEEEGGEAE